MLLLCAAQSLLSSKHGIRKVEITLHNVFVWLLTGNRIRTIEESSSSKFVWSLPRAEMTRRFRRILCTINDVFWSNRLSTTRVTQFQILVYVRVLSVNSKSARSESDKFNPSWNLLLLTWLSLLPSLICMYFGSKGSLRQYEQWNRSAGWTYSSFSHTSGVPLALSHFKQEGPCGFPRWAYYLLVWDIVRKVQWMIWATYHVIRYL